MACTCISDPDQPDHLSKVGDAMVALDAGAEIKTISAGGGLPTPYRPTDVPIDLDRYRQVWEDHRKKFEEKIGHSVGMEIEPGRYLVAEAGSLVTDLGHQEDSFLQVLPCRFVQPPDPARNVRAYHPCRFVQEMDVRWKRRTGRGRGALCESVTSYPGRRASRPGPAGGVGGDYLVIGWVRGRTMASNYNTHPFPAEVWLDDGAATLLLPDKVSKRFRDERIP
jgi:diaminopimelate decarboxylase